MPFGVNSEVGKLRKVMVHRPDLSLEADSRPRTTTSCSSTTSSGWERAPGSTTRSSTMRSTASRSCRPRMSARRETLEERRGTGVAARVGSPRGRHDDGLRAESAGVDGREADRRARHPSHRRRDGPGAARGRLALVRARPATHRLRAARRCPNQLFTRDSSVWIYGGVVVNPMFWPARRREALNVEAVYRFHPRFRRRIRVLVRRRRTTSAGRRSRAAT